MNDSTIPTSDTVVDPKIAEGLETMLGFADQMAAIKNSVSDQKLTVNLIEPVGEGLSATEYELAHGNAAALVSGTHRDSQNRLIHTASGLPLVEGTFSHPDFDGLPTIVVSPEEAGIFQAGEGGTANDHLEGGEVLSEEQEAQFLQLLAEDLEAKDGEPTTPPTPEQLAGMLSQASKMQSLFKDIKRFQKEYPMVMGKIVHVKKRSSKTRKKKR